jgi:type VI secretion system secreted protein Hcp
MAIDVYLQIEGIKGESRDAGHPDWIECLTGDLGVTLKGSRPWFYLR